MKKTFSLYRSSFLIALCFITLVSWGNSIWIYGKAELAQWLIKDAWEKTLVSGEHHLPWPWADTWPVARIQVPKQNIDYYVLAGSTGTSLAFGPGHIDGTALPNEHGTTVLSGHRDTHFRFLEHTKLNERIKVQDKTANWHHYEVAQKHIHDIEQSDWYIDPHQNELQLITCYPFDAIVTGGKLRHITIARKVYTPTQNTFSI